MACNCIGGNPCPCRRGGMMIMGRVEFEPAGSFPMMPPHLQELLKAAKTRTMTAKEAYEQKVSFIFGQLMDCAPNISKEEVKRHLAEMGVVDPEKQQYAAPDEGEKK